ncbi:MAG: membrane protein insertion efficiency factor YidD [candidate division Zixibacteria bacterium]|nr:membrane protein insertion efficiency factor YidD [candidate division Zixibacteria bacterium]
MANTIQSALHVECDSSKSSIIRRVIGAIFQTLFIGVIWTYRFTFAPLLSGGCRFEPSCSCYAEQAIRKHGPAQGGLLAIKRLLRCHPWGKFGPDPVP